MFLLGTSDHARRAVLWVAALGLACACGDDDDGDPAVVDDGGAGDPDGGTGDPDGGMGDPDGGMGDPDGGMLELDPAAVAGIERIIADNGCTASPCHDETAPAQGQDLTDFVPFTVNVPALQSDLDRIEPGDHQQSYLWHKVNGTHRDPPANGSGLQMPRGGTPLTDDEVAELAGFIDGLLAAD